MMSDHLLLVGCGNMGRAMLRGWLNAGRIRPEAVHVVEPDGALRKAALALGVNAYPSAEALDTGFRAEVTIFAIKPQVMAAALPAYRRHVEEGLTVSIAAGTPIAVITAGLGDVAIIRVMPNMPASIGKGSTVFFANERTSEAQAAGVARLLSANGAVHRLDSEAAIDAATAISGSGPAYLFHFIECLAEAGTRLGLPAETALSLARETVEGAGALAKGSGTSPAALRQQVTSPGGTTQAALDILMENDALLKIMLEAAVAAHRRAGELAARM
jgi:pyrroline-5-carboxylate reductase